MATRAGASGKDLFAVEESILSSPTDSLCRSRSGSVVQLISISLASVKVAHSILQLLLLQRIFLYRNLREAQRVSWQRKILSVTAPMLHRNKTERENGGERSIYVDHGVAKACSEPVKRPSSSCHNQSERFTFIQQRRSKVSTQWAPANEWKPLLFPFTYSMLRHVLA